MPERGPVDDLGVLGDVGAWSPSTGYDKTAEYRDFRAVLVDGGATPEQSKRVLNIIFAKCGLLRDPLHLELVGGDEKTGAGVAVETHLTFANIGAQNIGRWLLNQINTRPRSEPLAEEAITEEPD